jgi:hypothetical protein
MTTDIVPTDMDAKPAEPVKADSQELEAMRAKLAEFEADKAAAEAAKLTAEQKAEKELVAVREETAKLRREAAFLKAGVPEDLQKLLEEYRTLGDADPIKLAAKFEKFMAKIQKDAATSGTVGDRVNPTSSGDDTNAGKTAKKTKADWDRAYFNRPA